MALVRSKWSGRMGSSKKHQKVPPISKILLYFFYSSTLRWPPGLAIIRELKTCTRLKVKAFSRDHFILGRRKTWPIKKFALFFSNLPRPPPFL